MALVEYASLEDPALRAEFGGLGSHLVEICLILYGSALILMVRYAPQGIVGFIKKS